MQKALFPLLQICLYAFSFFFVLGETALAQVTSDGTVNTQVTQSGNVAEITGGETRGGNLFHSFQDFSVDTGNEASFNNADDISNIFSRVTGGNISNIDGTISANGSASLFLINPAGIIFGNNARLDLGGSFYGSTATSVLFEDGEFNAVDNLDEPVLTINAPIGLGFRDEPGDIVNRSFAQNGGGEFAGLEVTSGNNITLAGGNINFEAGVITARSGNINLGGLSQAGTVSIGENGSMSFPEGKAKSNISLSNGADINVISAGGGNITVNAQNLALEAGEFGSSVIRGGIRPEPASFEAQAGNITINVPEKISLDDSNIGNQVALGGVGNSGNITINTGSLELINGSSIDASTFGQGNAGAVNITASGNITADGENLEGFASGITSLVNTSAEGNAGGVTISTTNLELTAGGRVSASTSSNGNAGAINVAATGDITVDGETSDGFLSSIISQVNPGVRGNAGGVTISTTNLNLTAGGRVSADTFGSGNAGAINVAATGDITVDGEQPGGFPSAISSQVGIGAEGDSRGITISTTNLNLTAGGQVSANTLGSGNTGSVNVTATRDIRIDGEGSEGISSGIINEVASGAVGDSGGVTISTTNLNLTNGGQVDASTFGQGNAGAVDVIAKGDITADGDNSSGSLSGIFSQVNSDAEGNSGGVTISTTNLNLTNGGQVAADTLGTGNAGAVNVTATGDITADGENSGGSPSGISSQVGIGAEGDSGGVIISTINLNLTAGGGIDASTLGSGNAGAVNVTATGDITADGENSGGFPSGITNGVNSVAEGDAGGVTISTTNLNLTNGGRVSASTFGQGNANNVTINATESIFIDGLIESFRSGISADAINEDGNGGNVFVTTGDLTIADGGTIEATNFDNIGNNNPGTGQPGSINITANAIDLTDSARIEAATQFEGEASGNIDLTVAEDITLQDNSFISAEARNNANGGNLNIDTNFILAFPGDNDIIASAEQGQGGNINITADGLLGIQERPLNDATNDLNASSDVSGFEGNVEIQTLGINPLQGVIDIVANIVSPDQTTAQACNANREVAAQNGLSIEGKGGVPPAPDLPLNSAGVTIEGDNVAAIPQPVATSKGKIQPARGIKIGKNGDVILTAYATSNSKSRVPVIKRNCGI